MRYILLVLLLGYLLVSDQDGGRILSPEDGAALPPGEISIIAMAQAGKLLLDGEQLSIKQPFPDVFHAKVTPPPGKHRLTLAWENGKTEISFFVGDNPPEGFKLFRQHPPSPVECVQCHALSRKGRLRFTGGCFGCHEQGNFSKTHRHPPHILEQCGQCHAAHGSTAKAHLILPRDKACGLCHTVPSQ
jgi:predicted CXXCH cytochrome family protein